MVDLIALWQDAKDCDIVCSKNNITKRVVLQAITDGAKSIQTVQKAFNFSCDGSCASRNASGCSCHKNIEALVEIYSPLFQLMKHCHDSH